MKKQSVLTKESFVKAACFFVAMKKLKKFAFQVKGFSSSCLLVSKNVKIPIKK